MNQSYLQVIITGKNRVRINCVGMMDVLNFDPNKTIVQYQYEDLLQLGSLIVCIALRTPVAGTGMNIRLCSPIIPLTLL